MKKASAVDLSLIEELTQQTQDEIKKMKPIHILVVGKTGVGKSTLINRVFRERLVETGIGEPITKHLRQITKDNLPLVLYDTRGLELDAAIQDQVAREINECLDQLEAKGEIMHCAYYCINASSSRIEPMEKDFIQGLAEKMPVILVLTQAIGQPAQDFKKYLENLNLKVQAVVPIMAKDYPVTPDYTVEVYALNHLIEQTLAVIPLDVQDAFNNAQQGDLDRKARLARRWARRYIISTFGVGFTPIPFADAALIVPLQISMLAHITAIFGVSLEHQTLVGLIGAVGGTTGATFLGRTLVGNIFKLIPGLGSLAGGAISGATASIVTTALAMSYISVLRVIAEHDVRNEKLSAKSIRKLMQSEFRARLRRGKKDPDYQAIRNEQEKEKKEHKD
ncbi:GTPase [Aerococcus sp. UMB7834]|uniref:GTPase n=1 Tax=Aerococcus sp. UMB7834 TaxID=3046342 RepID=UPI00254F2962|nr:GTPase [Aerococcus sp. UMB7834]MDK6804371.1 50S ribosome-binding GTPase [Aerococcus sp. UMB7834]